MILVRNNEERGSSGLQTHLDLFDGGVRSRDGQAASIGSVAVQSAKLDLTMDCHTQDSDRVVRPPSRPCRGAAQMMHPAEEPVHGM